MPSASPQYNILIAESFSCQRDILLNLKNSWLRPYIQLFTSHSAPRTELLNVADHILDLTPKGEKSVEWMLEQCLKHKIDVLFIGKNSIRFATHRQLFEAHNIQLITGCTELKNHQLIDDKYQFTQLCLAQNLPAIPAYYFADVEQFKQSYQLAEQQHPQQILCAKPVHGVFAHGFIRFKADADFNGLFRIPVEINFEDFCDQYARLKKPPKYILMPFLTGQECSVDIACDRGEVISLATRIKEEYRQNIMLKGPCDEICHQLVKLFALDGLINIQFKQDQHDVWHILEINARPAGGFSYSIHTGRNLIADLMAKKLQLSPSPTQTYTDNIYSYPFTASISDNSPEI